MKVRAIAPAKLNLGLEVLGRRGDGFHEIRTILVAVSLIDRLSFRHAEPGRMTTTGMPVDDSDNLVLAASEAMSRIASAVTSEIQLDKRIPIAAGLGGASSDAAATLLAMDRLYGLRMDPQLLQSIALELGSDVPFFLHGGAALASGRGETLSPIALNCPMHVVIVAPATTIPRKTATLYGALVDADFSDGSKVDGLATTLSHEAGILPVQLPNAFERPLYGILPELSDLAGEMRRLGASAVGITGAGPSHFALCRDVAEAHDLAARFRKAFWTRSTVHCVRTMKGGVHLVGPNLDASE